MADMAGIGAVERAWETINAAGVEYLPVVYVNSTLAIKAFCGRNGGCACTSSNARKVFEWVMGQKKKIFFLPDEHLGMNTVDAMGMAETEALIYDQTMPGGGLTSGQIRAASVLAWKGFCRVHVMFTADHITDARRRWPASRIIVHPETPRPVARLADARGSTAQIIRYVREAPAGATIVIGTEINLVQRLAEEEQGRVTVVPLGHSACYNMARTTSDKLAALLTHWPEGNRIEVDPVLAREARLSLDRMLEL